MGAFEDTDLLGAAALALFAKEFDVETLGRHAGGRDGDEFAPRTGAGVMDQPRDQLLARAGRSRHQNPAVRGRHLANRGAELLRDSRLADQAVRDESPGAQHPVLALERRLFQGAVNDDQQAIGLEGFFDEVVGAALQRADGGFDVAVARDHDHRQVRIEILDQVEQLKPVHTAALHPDIQNHQGGLSRLDGRQRHVGVRGRPDRIALVFQEARDEVADIRLVVDHQHVRIDLAAHQAASSCVGPEGRSFRGNLRQTRAPVSSVASASARSPP